MVYCLVYCQFFKQCKSSGLVGLALRTNLSAAVGSDEWAATPRWLHVFLNSRDTHQTHKIRLQLGQPHNSSPLLTKWHLQLYVNPTERSTSSHWPKRISKTPSSETLFTVNSSRVMCPAAEHAGEI